MATAFGLTVLTGVYAFGTLSGGHFNPAVTLGAALARRVEWKALPLYWIVQVIGGLIAGLVIYIVAKGKPGFDAKGNMAANGFGEHSPGGYALWAVIVAEIVLTAVFLFVILGATDDRAPKGFAGLAIGLTLTIIHLVSIPISNTSVNPARSTGVAFSMAMAHRDSCGSSGWHRSSVRPSPGSFTRWCSGSPNNWQKGQSETIG